MSRGYATEYRDPYMDETFRVQNEIFRIKRDLESKTKFLDYAKNLKKHIPGLTKNLLYLNNLYVDSKRRDMNAYIVTSQLSNKDKNELLRISYVDPSNSSYYAKPILNGGFKRYKKRSNKRSKKLSRR
jgi:hypothetical protein